MAERSGNVPNGSAKDVSPAPRRSWRRRACWLILVAIAVAIFFAPVGVARYLESNGITLTGEGGNRFHVRMRDASLGWFSPVRFEDVRVDDDSGQPLLEAPRITSQRSLAGLATNRRQPGRFFVDEPNLNVVVRADGSNLEDFLSLLDRDRSEGGKAGRKATSIGATITQGLVSFTDAEGKPLLTIDEINCSGQQQRGTEFLIEVELSAHIVSESERRPIEAAIQWEGPTDGLPFLSGVGSAGVRFESIPLAVLQPHLARLDPSLEIHTGVLSGQLLVESDLRHSQALKATGEFLTYDIRGQTWSDDGSSKPFSWDQEPLSFNVQGQYDPPSDTLSIGDLTLQSRPLSLAATGSVTNLGGECLLEAGGQLQYDIETFVHSLAGDAAEHVQIEGLRTRSVQITGPLAMLDGGRRAWDFSRLNVAAEINWDRVDAFGVRSDQATVITRLQQGVLQIDPHEVPVSGGRLRAVSAVQFSGEDPAARIDAGPALENIAFSEEMCHLWLKYISPMLADATRVNGRFSIDLQESHFPLADPAAGQSSGSLNVQAGTVRPGPFAERIIGIVGTIKSLIDRKPGGLDPARLTITVPPQSVPFVMTDRRVRHEKMRFEVAGAIVQTSGSVGLDESLDLLIEVPLQESWFPNDVLSAALGGEVVRIPVQGTFGRPRFDLAPIRELTRRLATRATGSLLRKLLD